MPLTVSSASASSIRLSSRGHASIDMTFIDLPLTSHVITATPSAPFSMVKIGHVSLPLFCGAARRGAAEWLRRAR